MQSGVGTMHRRAAGVEGSDVIGWPTVRNCEDSAAGLSWSGTSAVFTACLGDRGTFCASRVCRYRGTEVRSLSLTCLSMVVSYSI